MNTANCNHSTFNDLTDFVGSPSVIGIATKDRDGEIEKSLATIAAEN